MNYFKRLILMLQFMTTIPIRINIQAEREDFGRSLSAAPAAGLVIGFLTACGNYLLGLLFPPLITAVLTVALYIILTGGLHLDGLGDMADGLFSNRSKDRMLKIMKDSRVGTNAVLILFIVLFLDVSIISSIRSHIAVILLLMPVAGRIGSLIGAGFAAYAGTSDGPGRWCVEYCGLKDVITGLISYFTIFIAAVLFLGIQGKVSGFLTYGIIIFFSLIPPVSAFLLTKIFGKKLGGVTGDILGAVCELNQAVFLLSSYLLLRNV